MNDLQIFNNVEFGQIRTITKDNEVWFVGRDIAEALGYSDTNKAVAMHVDDEDKQLNDKTSSSFGQRGATIINESGLYSLVLSSKLSSAKKFKRWITSEVLPSIRKHGGYLTPAKIEEVLLNPDTIIKLATDLKEERKISSDNASKIELTIDNVENDKTYFITIDGEQKSYTAKISDNVSNVLTNIYNQFSKENLNFNLSNDLLTISSNDKTKIFSINTNLIIKNVSSPIYFVSDIYGSINPTLGSVKNINTFITGWNSVSNIKNIVGRDAETDVELRQRWSSSVYSKASVMLEAIQANIYSNVAGVTACLAYENDSDTVDNENRPPHSIEIIVEGGSEDDIAKEIYNYKAPGINTFGDIEKTVLDNQGISHLIRFNRPKQVKIWLKITITKNTEQTWGENTPNEIKEIILQEASKINIGEDIILQKFIGAIYNNINAIAYIDIKATTGETPKEYNNNNIVISAHENATFDISQIEVIINE